MGCDAKEEYQKPEERYQEIISALEKDRKHLLKILLIGIGVTVNISLIFRRMPDFPMYLWMAGYIGAYCTVTMIISWLKGMK